MIDLTLLDYGVGNIHSIRKAFENAGARVGVAADPREILRAKRLILPGVGAFGKVAEQIAPIRQELRGRLEEGVPAFAVCIGMQALYESSEEGPGEGVGFFPGRVRRLAHRRLPHIGWNTVAHECRGPFEGLAPWSYFYFVHSYAPSECAEPCIATAEYGKKFAAAASRKNVWGFQFHPEKSSSPGRHLIEKFVEFAKERA